jgi:hypothetical protein
MRKIIVFGVFLLLVAALTASAYAAVKSYQFTGTVKTVQGTTFTVEKTPKEVWEFSTDAATKGTPKVGDKVTVQYRMIATEIEVKPATAAPKKK